MTSIWQLGAPSDVRIVRHVPGSTQPGARRGSGGGEAYEVFIETLKKRLYSAHSVFGHRR